MLFLLAHFCLDILGHYTPGARAAAVQIMGNEADANMDSYFRSVLGRNGVPDDIAKAAYFLASGLSDYMTGSLVLVDGGYLLI